MIVSHEAAKSHLSPTTLFQILLLIITLQLIVVSETSAHTNGDHIITITNDGFIPTELTIDQGETVTFFNQSENDAWPASNSHPTHTIYPEFDPKESIAIGKSWQFTFEKSGSWNYHDHLRSEYGGTILVTPSDRSTSAIKSEAQKPNKLTPKIFFKKLYFRLFPSQKTKLLQNISIIETLNQPELISELLIVISPKDILNDLETNARQDNKQCHLEAHLLAHQTYDLYQEKAFSYANSSCQSGFQHGVMEKFISQYGISDLGNRINLICSQFSDSLEKWECYHGVGHGVIAFEGYDVPAAVKDCQNAFDHEYASSCISGVFMENIFSFNNPDHKSLWINEDLHFPCTQFTDEDILNECYRYQTIHFRDVLGDDRLTIAAECLKSPSNQIAVCFRSLGRDTAYDYLNSLAASEKACESLPQGKNDCFDGALAFYWETFRHDKAFEYQPICSTLSNSTNRQKCLQIFGP